MYHIFKQCIKVKHLTFCKDKKAGAQLQCETQYALTDLMSHSVKDENHFHIRIVCE